MAKSVKPSDLGAAIGEALTIYSKNVTERIDKLSEEAAKELVKITKKTAPKKSGDYRKHIASTVFKGPRGNTAVWYVKAPKHRLTHIFTKGRAKKNGGRTKADPFLANAVEQVIPKFEKDSEEVLQNAE